MAKSALLSSLTLSIFPKFTNNGFDRKVINIENTGSVSSVSVVP